MSDPSVNQEAYNQVAAHYALEHSQELAWQPELDVFTNYLSQPGTIIDLGCGPGDETIYLANKLPSTHVIGIDFAEQIINLAMSRSSRADFIVGDIAALRAHRLGSC